jgi:hypothetical protein
VIERARTKKEKSLMQREVHTKQLATGLFGHKRPRPGDDPQMQVDSDCPDRWRMDGSGGVGFKAMLLLLALVPGTMNEELELDICIGSRVAD